MSDDGPTGDTRPVEAVSPLRTAELPAVGAGSEAGPGWVPVPAAFPPEDDIEEWMTPPPARGWRLRGPTVALLALGFLAAGFWVGAVVQKHDGSSSTSATASSLAARIRAAGLGPSAAGGSVTRGTVIDVTGNVVSITDATTSAIDRLRVGPSTTVTRTGIGSAGNPRIGDTVVVRGSAGAGGMVDATSVVATAPGAAPAGAGFGARFSGGAAAGSAAAGG